MNVSLTPELEQLVNTKVKSGRYTSASEVIREALRLFEEQDQVKKAQWYKLRHDIRLGLEEADRGDLIPLNLEEIRQEGEKRLAKRKRRK